MRRSTESFPTEVADKILNLKNEIDNKKLLEILKRTWESKEPQELVHEFPGCVARELIQKRTLETAQEKLPVLSSESIIIESEDNPKNKIYLNSLIPPETYFLNINYQKFRQDPEHSMEDCWLCLHKINKEGKRMQMIFYPGLDRIGDRISLLHEIGHARRRLFQEEQTEVEEELESEYKESASYHRKIPREDEILARLGTKQSLRPVDLDLIFNYLELSAREERGAWAFALEKLHKARQQGIDLEPSIKSFKQLKEIVHGKRGLGSYEEHTSKLFPQNPELLGFFSDYYVRKKTEG